MTVLITGGCGLVGIHVAKEFAAQGHEVLCVDARPPSVIQTAILADQAPRVRFVQGDVCDFDWLCKLVGRTRLGAVIHSAALINESYSRAHPLETERVNMHGTATVVEMARAAGCRRVVFTSSATVYGPRGDGAPVAETEERPAHVYGYSKYLAERWLDCYADIYGMHCTIVRLSSVYGPGKPFDPDRYPQQKLCAEAMKGSTYTLPDGGDYARDFTYAPDAANGIYLAYARAGKESRRFNIASGRLFTLREVAQALNRIYPAARLSVAPGRFQGHVSLAGSTRGPLDIAKARAELGFHPSFSLIDGLRAYTSFLQRYPSAMPA